MNTHIIILKSNPYYIYCQSEEEAITAVEDYKNNEVVGVVVNSDLGLQMMEVKTKASLSRQDPVKLPIYVSIDENTIEEVPEGHTDMPKEFSDIIEEGLNE